MNPSVPDESARLAALHRLGILDTPAEPIYDDLVRLAAHVCQTPIALISFLDRDRQWFKATHGASIRQMPRELSFCNHTIANANAPRPFQISDAVGDPRFRENPLVIQGPMIRFYAGAALVVNGSAAVGTLCVVDRKPGKLSEGQLHALCVLARSAVAHLEQRAALKPGAAIHPSKQAAVAKLGDRAGNPIDAESLLRRHDRQTTVVEKLLTDFEQQLGRQMDSLRLELQRRDAENLARLAHTLEDAASDVAAEPLRASAAEFEAMISAGDFESAAACLRQIEAEARDCINYLPTAAATVRRARHSW